MSRRQATTSHSEDQRPREFSLYTSLHLIFGDIWGSFGKIRLVTEDVCAVVKGHPWMSPLTLAATPFDRNITPTHIST